MNQDKLMLNVQDIAAANVGFQLIQAVIDMLIKKRVILYFTYPRAKSAGHPYFCKRNRVQFSGRPLARLPPQAPRSCHRHRRAGMPRIAGIEA